METTPTLLGTVRPPVRDTTGKLVKPAIKLDQTRWDEWKRNKQLDIEAKSIKYRERKERLAREAAMEGRHRSESPESWRKLGSFAGDALEAAKAMSSSPEGSYSPKSLLLSRGSPAKSSPAREDEDADTASAGADDDVLQVSEWQPPIEVEGRHNAEPPNDDALFLAGRKTIVATGVLAYTPAPNERGAIVYMKKAAPGAKPKLAKGKSATPPGGKPAGGTKAKPKQAPAPPPPRAAAPEEEEVFVVAAPPVDPKDLSDQSLSAKEAAAKGQFSTRMKMALGFATEGKRKMRGQQAAKTAGTTADVPTFQDEATLIDSERKRATAETQKTVKASQRTLGIPPKSFNSMTYGGESTYGEKRLWKKSRFGSDAEGAATATPSAFAQGIADPDVGGAEQEAFFRGGARDTGKYYRNRTQTVEELAEGSESAEERLTLAQRVERKLEILFSYPHFGNYVEYQSIWEKGFALEYRS